MHFETELEKGELFSRFIDLPQRLCDFSSIKRNPCQTPEAQRSISFFDQKGDLFYWSRESVNVCIK